MLLAQRPSLAFGSLRVVRGLALLALGALVAGGDAAVAGELRVGAGSSLDLGSGTIDLGCSDLAVAGTLRVGDGSLARARDVSVDPLGVLEGQSGTIELAGDWQRLGTFQAGSGTVRLADGCDRLDASVRDDTTFADLVILSDVGKTFRFEAGSTQQVTGTLTAIGSAFDLLFLRSTSAGATAALIVQGAGTADFVDVGDNDASGGEPIVLGPLSVKGPNTPGWLAPLLVPAPLLGTLGLLALTLAVAWGGWRALVRGGAR